MDPQLQLLIGLLSIAVTILIGTIVASWQLGRVVDRVVKVIHDDIKHSQEKLERKIKRELDLSLISSSNTWG